METINSPREDKASRSTAKAFLQANQRDGERSLSDFYSEALGPVLSDKVRQLLDNPHDEQISLYNELAIARANYAETLKLNRAIHEKGNEKLSAVDKALIIQTMNDASKEVKDLTLASSKIEKESSSKVSSRVVGIILTRVMMAINDVCGIDNENIGNNIKKAIDDRIRLPLSQRCDPVIQVNLLDAGE